MTVAVLSLFAAALIALVFALTEPSQPSELSPSTPLAPIPGVALPPNKLESGGWGSESEPAQARSVKSWSEIFSGGFAALGLVGTGRAAGNLPAHRRGRARREVSRCTAGLDVGQNALIARLMELSIVPARYLRRSPRSRLAQAAQKGSTVLWFSVTSVRLSEPFFDGLLDMGIVLLAALVGLVALVLLVALWLS
ncbi:MAG: hypothetical protein AB7I38_12000 [Dehalococcoidia bacterium]